MGFPLVYNWIAPVTNYVAQTQTATGSGSMQLNGTGGVSRLEMPVPKAIYFGKYYRTVTLTSASNNSGVSFVITGTMDGIRVTETIAGPNANTVTTTATFDSITSITYSGSITAVSAGIGSSGGISWIPLDFNRAVFNLGIQVAVSSANITYTFQVTLDDINDRAHLLNPTQFSPISAMTSATTNQLANYTNPVRNIRLTISATDNSTLTAQFLQQGVT